MPNDSQVLRPVCYMVMPFRKKKVEEPLPPGAPAEIDFDALWERVYRPVIQALNFLPMRADFDPSSAIVKAMLERITYADLVLADITLGNGNVYYEVGIRHVAQETRCVLVAPDWTRPLFDIGQFASIRFPLASGDIPESEAAVIRDKLLSSIPALIDARNPYHELIDGLRDVAARRGAFRDFAELLNVFQSGVGTVRRERDPAQRKARLAELRASVEPAALRIPEVALDLVVLIRNEMGWQEVRAFIETLPSAVYRLPFVREQYLLALAESGDPVSAIAQLETLIAEQGATPERHGLIGGRYKRLWRNERKAREARGESEPSLEELQHLENAIASYTAGMELDYNQYYCSSNLPLLLRARNDEGDAERAAVLEHFVVAACERARARGEGDEWLRPTLLGAAFRSGDTKKAAELAKSVKLEGPVVWQLASTLGDLAEALRQTTDPDKLARLGAHYSDLERLVQPKA